MIPTRSKQVEMTLLRRQLDENDCIVMCAFLEISAIGLQYFPDLQVFSCESRQ